MSVHPDVEANISDAIGSDSANVRALMYAVEPLLDLIAGTLASFDAHGRTPSTQPVQNEHCSTEIRASLL